MWSNPPRPLFNYFNFTNYDIHHCVIFSISVFYFPFFVCVCVRACVSVSVCNVCTYVNSLWSQTPPPPMNIWSNHCTEYTQKNGAVSKVNKKFISHLTRAPRTPSVAATVQVSRALPAVRFSCLLRDRGASFQDGVVAKKDVLCAPF